MNNLPTPAQENGFEIAVIGMSGRFPGARSVDEFWLNLRAGVESIVRLSDEELVASGIEPATFNAPNYVKAIGVLDDVEWFDASFFGYTAREAELMDPQHRLFLECTWEALEHAGYDPARYEGLIGVYGGSVMNTYLLNNLLSHPGLVESHPGLPVVLGNDKDYLTTRVSYKLNLRGPSIGVQTACSTSLVAVHLACQSLLQGECDIALAGGASITVPVKAGYFYQEGAITSPDGHCRAFDAQAQGTVGGNGVGLVVLKRLSDAVRDGDTIHAVIKSSAINNDGSLKVGFTAPSVEGQAQVISEALLMAGVEAETISYIEAHGTGTALGDPIEVAALTQAFSGKTAKKGFCAIGSVKTNIGHLDAAAGVAGLIKTLLALRHQEIPPSLHYEKPNPRMNLDDGAFYVNAKLCPWKTAGTPRRAGVSAFGLGGTNVHVVVEEAPAKEKSSKSRPWHLLTLSAKSAAALDNVTNNLFDYLKREPNLNVADVAYTLKVGRSGFEHRRMLVCSDLNDAVSALERVDPKRVSTRCPDARNLPVVFMFPGQGAQYVNMGLELYETEPVFRKHMDGCCEMLKAELGADLRSILYPGTERMEAAEKRLQQTYLTQPALFVIEYALAQLWMSWGVKPQAMIGHSIGEFVAGCLAGVFSLEDGLALVAKRGRLMQELPEGAMLAVPLSEKEVGPLLHSRLSLAAVNEPSLCVVSGPNDAVERLETDLAEKGISARRLHTSHAFHSAMMDPILEAFTAEVRKVNLLPPRIPYVSNVSGTWVTAKQATDPGYWACHLRQTVRFTDGISELLRESQRVLVEVGPGQTLMTLVRRQKGRGSERLIAGSMRHPQERQSDVAFLLTTLGQLWISGVEVDWHSFYEGERRHRIPVPTYPFERKRYWVEPLQQRSNKEYRAGSGGKKGDVSDWFYLPSWRRTSLPLSHPARGLDLHAPWLVFVDRQEIGERLVQRLQKMGHEIFAVAIGEEPRDLGEKLCAIRPSEPRDYEALLEVLRRHGKIPEIIVHLWGLEPSEESLPEIARAEKAQETGFYSLLYLTQAIGKQNVAGSFRITAVTSQVQEVTGDERLAPEKATVLGACKVIPQEFPYISCCAVDVVVAEDDLHQKALVEQLIGELIGKSSDSVVAYRGGHRWVQSFEAVRLESGDELPSRLRERGVYLIVGGLGGVGLEVADYLARRARARLVLVGRTGLPPREEWSAWLSAHEGDDDVSFRIRKVQALEQLGAEVLVARADVTHEEQLAAVLAEAEQRFGVVYGGVYVVGAVKTVQPIQETGRSEWEQQLRPKLHGLRVLEKVLRYRELDFCLLQSSLSSVLGASGMSGYVAAHLLMDAFAWKQSHVGPVPWLTVNWDNWITSQEADAGLKPDSTFFMTPEEAQEALHRVFAAAPATQIIVSTGDLQQRFDAWVKLESLRSEIRAGAEDLGARHSRPDLKTDFVAPRNEVEKILAAIWCECMGLEQVGIEDNFFELGGDSVLSIQMIAKAHKGGLRITTKQIFDCQTIGELAAVVKPAARTLSAEQGLVTGPVPLTPIQRWFFERDLPDPHHFNLPLWLELSAPVDLAALEKALQECVRHHDALRLRYICAESGWKQIHGKLEGAVVLTRLDLSSMSPSEQELAMEKMASSFQASLNLSEGPLVRAVFFDFGSKASSRLLLVAHHLVVDFVSWRIILEDLVTAYQQLTQGKVVQLPPKTTSFKQWAEELSTYAQTEALERELNYWLSLPWAKLSALPLDNAAGANNEASARLLLLSLTEQETETLLRDAPKVFDARIQELLLTALVSALSSWTQAPALAIDLEGHGREGFIDGVDLSRTAGWFTTIYTVVLELESSATLDEAIKSIKNQARRLPNQGTGYGLLRYLSSKRDVVEKLRSFPHPEVSFVYLGQFDQDMARASPFRLLSSFPGDASNPQGQRSHKLEIATLVMDGRFQVRWSYSENLHRRDTVEAVARDFVNSLRSLITQAQSHGARELFPADFPAARLSHGDLDKLIAKISQF